MTDQSHAHRRPTTAYLSLALALTLAGCSQGATPSTSAGVGASNRAGTTAAVSYVYDGTDHSWTASKSELAMIRTQSIDSGDNTLSNESFTAATNGYGPVERNKSNGDLNAGDGRTLSLGGKSYSSGFGAHANSSLSFAVGGKCSTFTADIGVDDEVGDRGSVAFQVYGDGIKLYDSGVMTGATGGKSISVDIKGRNELKLVVTNGGDNNYYDHADWANAMLSSCTAVAGTASAPAPATSAPAYSGPIVITKGGTYTGNWQSLDPNVPAVYVQTKEPVIIENSNIRSKGHLIRGWWMNLTVRNTNGYGLNPNVAGMKAGRFIAAEDILNLVVENNYFENTSGIYTNVFRGTESGQTVKILRNRVRNVDGRLSDGNGGYQHARDMVHFVQLGRVRNRPGVEIAWNEVINEPGKSAVEENINTYESLGLPNDRIKIHDNYIQGAYPVWPTIDTGYSGGGIGVGDGDVSSLSTAGGYTDVYRNQIVNTTNQGIGIAGGHDQNVYENRVLSSGRLQDGTIIPAQNGGIYVWDILNGKKNGTWFNNSMHDNVVGWTRFAANGSTFTNNWWFADCDSTLCFNNKGWGSDVTLETEKQEFQLWKNKTASAGVSVGPK